MLNVGDKVIVLENPYNSNIVGKVGLISSIVEGTEAIWVDLNDGHKGLLGEDGHPLYACEVELFNE